MTAAESIGGMLCSRSGAGKGRSAGTGLGSGVLSHIPLKNACLLRWGGCSESVSDTSSQKKTHISRDTVDKLEAWMAKTYSESFNLKRRLAIIEHRNLARFADNCNKSAAAKTLRTGKGANCKQMVAVAGQELHFERDLLSHDPDRPPAYCRFDESVVRKFLEDLKGSTTWERVKLKCRVSHAVLGEDTGDDPHIHIMRKVPPINMASSDRTLFEKHLVDDFNRNVGDVLTELDIDTVHTWDPEFALYTAAVAASDISKVQTWIQFPAVWHAAMHMMKSGFALPGNVIYFWKKYFNGPVRYR